MDAVTPTPPTPHSHGITSPGLIAGIVVLALICGYMFMRATALQADEHRIDVQLTHARRHYEQFVKNLDFEHQAYKQLAHDFAVVVRVQKTAPRYYE